MDDVRPIILIREVPEITFEDGLFIARHPNSGGGIIHAYTPHVLRLVHNEVGRTLAEFDARNRAKVVNWR